VACEPPKMAGRPVTHWTPRELAEEMIKPGVVPSISARHVGRFLKDGGTSVAKEQQLLNANPADAVAFKQRSRW
jgi:putative transposase